MSSDDYGKDLSSVQALQRKNEATTRDLAAIEDKLTSLRSAANNLSSKYPQHTDQINDKEAELEAHWKTLCRKLKERQKHLEDSYLWHKFLSDFRDLVSWINEMKVKLTSADLAKDVNSAETLLERHAEHKSELDARMDSFNSAFKQGQVLLDRDHINAEEVDEKLRNLADGKETLDRIWEERRILYEQCMDLNLYYRDTEQADACMAKQEAFLDNQNVGDSVDAVEVVIKKHEDFEKSLAAQEEKIKALDEFATKLCEGKHYSSQEIEEKRQKLLQRRSELQVISRTSRYSKLQ